MFPALSRCRAGDAIGIIRGNRNVVADCTMGPVFVRAAAPILQFFAGICQAHETAGIQTFRLRRAVERLDEAMARGRARPRDVQPDVVGRGPQIEVARDELTAVADPDRSRPADPPQARSSVCTTSSPRRLTRGSVAGQRRECASMMVRRRSFLPGANCRERTAGPRSEIHRPCMVRPVRFLAILPQPCLHAPLGMPVPELRAHLVVNLLRAFFMVIPQTSPLSSTSTRLQPWRACPQYGGGMAQRLRPSLPAFKPR